MARNFTTNILIGGRINPSLQRAFNTAGRYAQRTADIMSNVNNRVAASTDRLKSGISSVANIGKKVAIASGVIGGAALIGSKSMVDQASNLEQYRNTLNVVMKDHKKAAQTFKWATEFANKTPFETDEIVQAAVKLTSYGVEAQKVLPMIGDMAGVMGKSMDSAVEAVADAQTGELERLKEFGITKQQIIDHASKIMRGKQIVNNKGQITDQQAFNKALFSLMQDRFKGGMELQANTFKGIMSTISGIWKTGLARMAGISDTGDVIKGSMFDIVKQKAAQLGDVMIKLQNNGTFDKLQKKISEFTSKGISKLEESLPSIIKFGKDIIKNAPEIFNSIGEGITKIKDLSTNVINFGVYLSQNGPGIIDTIKTIGIGFLAWKTIEGIANGIIIITNLRNALATLRAVHLASAIAKAKDILATMYLQALYAKDAIIAAVKTAGTWAMVVAQGALNAVTLVGTGIMTAFGAVLTFITSQAGLVVLAIAALIAIGVLLYKNWGTVSQFLIKSWDGIKSGFTSGVNWVVDKINWLIEKINKVPGVEIPLIPKVKGSTEKIETNISSTPMKKYALGGIARTASIFGEAGPEMAIPLKPKSPRSISLLNKTADILGVSSGKKTGGDTFIFAPQLQSNSLSEIKQMLEDEYEKFKEFIERYKGEEGRVAYE